MAKRKSKPKSPEQIAAEKRKRRTADFEALDLPTEAANLPANEDVEIRREGRTNLAGARRLDAFDALKKDMEPGAYDAVRRLEGDLLLSRGVADRGRVGERVDNSPTTDLMDAMLAASERATDALGKIGERDAWLLVELIAPSAAMQMKIRTWRDIVSHITGETHTHAQAAAVRGACANLVRSQRGPDRKGAVQVWQAEERHDQKQPA